STRASSEKGEFQDGCVHQHSTPGSIHSTSPRRKRHVLDQELVRARLRGAAGQEGAMFADDQWTLRGRPTWHQKQIPPLGRKG
ncbi:hypothetical protein STEG23_010858, partial [Scotinomys teguina]